MDWRESFQQIFLADSFDYSLVENFKGFLPEGRRYGEEGRTEPKAVTTSFSILNAS